MDQAVNRVCVILDPTFGERLCDLKPAIPVWIVQSPLNDPVITRLWAEKKRNITSYRPEPFEGLMDTIDQHHPNWSVLETYGLVPDDAAAALIQYGKGRFTPTTYGFVFERDVS